MAKRLFRGDDLKLAVRIAEIVYCNPFEQRRWDLERECLQDRYTEGYGFLRSRNDAYGLGPNLTILLAEASRLLDASRQVLLEAGNADWLENDLQTYESLVHFVLYHEMVERFDGILESMLEGRSMPGRVSFFRKCRDRMRYYFSVHAALRISAEREGQYFAFYFQIRRAWLIIFKFIVGQSKPIVELRSRIWQSSFTRDMRLYQRSLYDRMGDIVTLITGPSGSGKELVARAVGLSRFVPFDPVKEAFAEDFSKVFFPLNLSALSPTLIESELFGHRKGAFTGALQERSGYFEECGTYGTVFLDEIGETDPSIQVKLLRVLQTRQFQRLGDTRSQHFVGKIMAATNRDLQSEISRGNFREDFYYRLCSDRIQTPSLQSLLADAPNELECMVEFIANKVAGPLDGNDLAEESCSWIRKKLGASYAWQGNVRELEQCVRNIMVSGAYEPARESGSTRPSSQMLTASQLLSRYAKEVYRNCGSYEDTARILKIDRRTAKKYILDVG